MPTFAEPVYFWMLLALLPLFLLRFRAHRLSRKGTPGLVATRLSKDLVIGANPWLRWLSFTFHCLALTFLVVALARPQWGHEEVATESEGRNIIIAMDTSRSMLATDLLPDRLTRARLAAQDLVDSLPNDRIGLIAFAGRSFLQAPLTMDHLAVVETLNQLDTEIIPRGGTNINSAVTMAIETFQKADSKDNALILFSDGEDLEGGEALAQIGKDAENLGLIIVAIGVGTEAGSIIPDPNANGPGVFIKNDGGDIVRSRLDPRALQQLSAHTSRGIYLNLGAANSITEIVGKALSQIEVSRQDEVAKKRPIERFAWALVLALISMLTAFLLPISLRGKHMTSQHRPQSVKTGHPKKRSQLPPPLPTNVNTAAKSALILLASFFTAALSQAQNEEPPSIDPTAQESAPATSGDETPNVPALEAFQNEDYDTAVNNYKQEIATAESPDKESWLQFGLGSAAYRAGDFELAEQSFGKVLERQNRSQITADAHYNLGNTLFRHGQALLKADPAANDTAPSSGTGQGDMEGATRQWEAALEHYQAALKTQPGHTLSTQNLKTVGLHLKQLKKQQEEQKKKEEDKDKEEEKEEEDEKDKDDQQDEDKDENKDNSKDPNQDPNQDQNQKPNPDDSKGDQEPPEDQDKNKGDQKPPENKDPNKGDGKDQKSPPPSDSKDPDDQKKQSDKPKGQPKDQQDGEQKPGEKQDPQQQKPGEPRQKDPEGNLKANPNQQQPTQPADTREGQEDQKRNPETGFSPLEARRLLQSLSDEDLSVKPLIRPSSAQPYKNW